MATAAAAMSLPRRMLDPSRMKPPRVFRGMGKRIQTYRLPSAAAEVWEPVERGLQLVHRLGLALESVDAGGMRLTPIRCVILAMIGRQDGLGITAGRLARELRLPRATLTHHLNALGNRYLIAYSNHDLFDRRKKLLVLTDQGAIALNRAAELLVELTTGGTWPENAHERHYWNQKRVPREWADVAWGELAYYLGPNVAPVTTPPPPDYRTRSREHWERETDRILRAAATRKKNRPKRRWRRRRRWR